MNEFITKEENKFLEEALKSNHPLKEIKTVISIILDRKEKEPKYIGKTDTEGNKIYANSSIVEFTMNYTDGCLPEKARGVFVYNNDTCSYDIVCEWEEKFAHNSFWVGKAIDFKIIDTIQENKLGLINE